MQYKILGGQMPVVECRLQAGESVRCEAGAMCWMSENMRMETDAGGIGKMFGRMFTGEKLFTNTYTAVGGEGMVAFAASMPGAIIPVELNGTDIICQKRAYLASSPNVNMSVHFQKQVGSGLLGGEGFMMERISGKGIVFIEVDGATVEKVLAPGEKLVIDTGYLAMMDASCSMNVESIKGAKNALFGGEGLFNTVVTGPGRVLLQTMPIYQMASVLAPFITTKS